MTIIKNALISCSSWMDISYCKGRKTLVFLPLIATSQKFVEILQRHGFRTGEVNGSSHDREETLQRFRNGEMDVLCNAMLLTEGYDDPSIDTIVVLRPTKVRSLYAQMVGRGTRLHPGKDKLLLLDFLWLTDKNDLCHPTSLIAKDEAVAAQSAKIIEDHTGVELDLQEVVEKAESDVVQQREESLAKELAQLRKRKKKLVDPLQYEMSIQDEQLINYVPAFGWEKQSASQAQIEFLEKWGIYADDTMTRGKADLIQQKLISRREHGLATPKQIRLLERYRFKQVGRWSFDDAQKMISRIAFNQWRTPVGVNAEKYHEGLPL